MSSTPLLTQTISLSTQQRRQKLLVELQGRELADAYLRPDIRQALVEEANDPSPGRLIDPEQLALLDAQAQEQQAMLKEAQTRVVPELFFSTDKVIIVPGLMGSELSDTSPGGRGLIWLSPAIAFQDRLSALTLAPFEDGVLEHEQISNASVEATNVVPIAYALLRGQLEIRRYDVDYHYFDWRKNVETSAQSLVNRLRGLANDSMPIHLIAHSQGALVTLRALRILKAGGENNVLDKIRHLVLLGPATYGSFSAAFAIAGTHSLLEPLRQYTIEPAIGFQKVLSSMTGIYQLLPSDPTRIPWLTTNPLGSTEFWQSISVDGDRLQRFFGWAKENTDISFFHDKTTVILGDNGGTPTTAGAVFDGTRLLPSADGLSGDGTVPHSCSVMPGVATYIAHNTEHSKLALYPHVINAVRAIFRGDNPANSRITRSSDNPADYTTPRTFATIVPEMVPGVVREEAVAGLVSVPVEPTLSFDQLLRTLSNIASRDGVRATISVSIEPR